MITFWIAAFLAMAAVAALIVLYSKRPVAVAADPAQAVYLRQLAEFDEMAERGLIGADEHAMAKAEAARRALKEQAGPPESPPTRASRLIVIAGIALVGLVSLGAYLVVGRPDMPDQPYKQRLEEWRESFNIQNIDSLAPAQLAALLKERAAENPRDPELLRLLALMQERSGDDLSAARTLEQSLAVDPASAEAWSMLGQLRARMAEGEITPEAREALARALALDPKAVAPRYLLGKAEIDAGRREQGVAVWRALLADLGPEQQGILSREIAEAEGAPAAGVAADPAIRAMVDRLAARLKEDPDDAAGWARLVRSYRVLGDQAALDSAMAEARARFKDRPADLAAIEEAVNAPQ